MSEEDFRIDCIKLLEKKHWESPAIRAVFPRDRQLFMRLLMIGKTPMEALDLVRKIRKCSPFDEVAYLIVEEISRSEQIASFEKLKKVLDDDAV